jgi:hypothetical protein
VKACCRDPVAVLEEPFVGGACCQCPDAARGQEPVAAPEQEPVAAPEQEPVAVPACYHYPDAAQNSETSSLR